MARNITTTFDQWNLFLESGKLQRVLLHRFSSVKSANVSSLRATVSRQVAPAPHARSQGGVKRDILTPSPVPVHPLQRPPRAGPHGRVCSVRRRSQIRDEAALLGAW